MSDTKNEFDTPEIVVPEIIKGIETKTNADILTELSALELEEKALDLEIKRETVAKIRSQRNAKLEEARSKILATMQFLMQRKMNQANCNHRKGGIGAEAVMRGQGSDAMYAVIKHKLPHGKHFVLCQRCGAEWHPPVPILGEKGTPGWAEAVNWPTDNSPSGSSTFLFERVTA
jgi:hypothetical protein